MPNLLVYKFFVHALVYIGILDEQVAWQRWARIRIRI